MSGFEVRTLVADRLRATVPARSVFEGAVPSGSLPECFLLVRTNEGAEGASRMVGTVSLQRPSIWVTSVSLDVSPPVACDEAAAGAAFVRQALRNWSPVSGGWRLVAEVSEPARPDGSLPNAAAYAAVEQFSVRLAL